MKIQNTVFSFVPQGWAFFTRNPREAQVIIYKKNSNDELIEMCQRHSSTSNLFGLNRKAATYMVEIALIKENLNDSLFQNTEWNYQQKIFSKLPIKSYNVKNLMKTHLLKGKYVIVFQKPIPWAWVKSINKIKMPAKIICLNIE